MGNKFKELKPFTLCPFEVRERMLYEGLALLVKAHRAASEAHDLSKGMRGGGEMCYLFDSKKERKVNFPEFAEYLKRTKRGYRETETKRAAEMLSDDMWELVKTIEDMQRKQAEKKKAKEKAGEAAHFAKQAELQ